MKLLKNPQCGWFYITNQKDFKKIPGNPIGYWANEKTLEVFNDAEILGKQVSPMQGLTTTNNARFIREWREITKIKLGLNLNRIEAITSDYKWFPVNKGGEFRKWYGNDIYVVNFENDGESLKRVVKEKYRDAVYAKDFSDENGIN